MPVCSILFKSLNIIWESFDLDCKSLNNCRHIGMEDLPHEFFIEKFSINVEFLNNRTVEITAEAYLASIIEIVTDCQKIGTGALLIIHDCILGSLWGNQYFFLFDSHSKNEIERMSDTATAVFLKFGSLQSLENYIKSVLLKLPNYSLLSSTIFKTKYALRMQIAQLKKH